MITVSLAILVILGLVLYLVVKAARRQPSTGTEGMIGKTAEAKSEDMVYVDGALWKVACDEPLEKGDRVEIVAVDKLTLKVKKTNP